MIFPIKMNAAEASLRVLFKAALAVMESNDYEAAATLRKKARFTMENGALVEGVIVDFFHKDKAEWLRMKDGQELRLDRIAAFVLV